MPATTRRRRARDDDVHSGSEDSDAPEEVTGSSARAAATARRGAEREATRAKREENKAAAAVKKRKEAERVAEVVKKKRTKEEKAAADEADEDEDDLEELPDDVVDALGRRERGERNVGGETSESDDEDAGAFEAHVSGGKKRKKPKGKKAKRRAYERDGFEVVALDVDGEDDGAGGVVGAPVSAMDFMRSRLLEKHARSGEMLRNAKTGRIPNAFARR